MGGADNTGNGSFHAYLYSGGIMTSLGTLGGNYSEAYEINDADQIVGESKTAGGQFHAFLYSGGSMIDLGTFGGTRSKAFGINEAGQVVGGARDAGENDRAFFYDTGTMYDLNTLAAGYMGGAGFTSLRYAYGINDSGQIVGYGMHTDGNFRAFSLSLAAVPEPSTYAVLAGLMALGLAAWRRQTRRAA